MKDGEEVQEHQESYLKHFLNKVIFLSLCQHTPLSILLEFSSHCAFYEVSVSCDILCLFFCIRWKIFTVLTFLSRFVLRLRVVQTDLERLLSILRLRLSRFAVRCFPLRARIMNAFNWSSAQRLLPFKNVYPGVIFIFRSDDKGYALWQVYSVVKG